jgi:hypothetical protein
VTARSPCARGCEALRYCHASCSYLGRLGRSKLDHNRIDGRANPAGSGHALVPVDDEILAPHLDQIDRRQICELLVRLEDAGPAVLPMLGAERWDRQEVGCRVRWMPDCPGDRLCRHYLRPGKRARQRIRVRNEVIERRSQTWLPAGKPLENRAEAHAMVHSSPSFDRRGVGVQHHRVAD